MDLSEDEWRARLTPEQYKILREQGTEAPFSGKLLYNEEQGIYVCAACGNQLFSSDHKYDSSTPGLIGWPSFYDISTSDAVDFRRDSSLGMERTEVVCKKCGGHLGHVFDDESSPNGKHYCINSCSLEFTPRK